ncbi:hypothetical protein [Pseudomonas sp. CAM1A]|uniref:hypothetical protein n=1 Tax=Pseudomonas sp. CAM1A TaxID=3231717 RepID=UPI0039C75FCD
MTETIIISLGNSSTGAKLMTKSEIINGDSLPQPEADAPAHDSGAVEETLRRQLMGDNQAETAFERHPDMTIGALRRQIESLGGTLDVVACLPEGRRVLLTGFE